MDDTNSLLAMIKQAAVEAVSAMCPCDYCYGDIVSVSPLKIKIDQKLILGSEQVTIAPDVTTYHVGDKAVLLRKLGGQEYLMFGRWCSHVA